MFIALYLNQGKFLLLRDSYKLYNGMCDGCTSVPKIVPSITFSTYKKFSMHSAHPGLHSEISLKIACVTKN